MGATIVRYLARLVGFPTFLAESRSQLAGPLWSKSTLGEDDFLHNSRILESYGVQPSYAMPLCGQTPRISTKVMPTKSARGWSPVPGNGPLLDAAFAFVRLHQYVPVENVTRPSGIAEYKSLSPSEESGVAGKRSDLEAMP